MRESAYAWGIIGLIALALAVGVGFSWSADSALEPNGPDHRPGRAVSVVSAHPPESVDLDREAVDGASTERPRAAKPSRPVRLQVVGPEGEPLAGAAVCWVDETMRPSRNEAAAGPEPRTLPERIQRLGTKSVTDRRGLVELPVVGAHLAVHAHRDQLAGSAVFQLDAEAAPRPLVLRIEGGHTLSLRLLDYDGRPIAGAGVAVCWPVDAAVAEGDPSRALVSRGESRADGRLTIPGWRWFVRDLESVVPAARAGLRVGPAWAGADATDYVAVTAVAGPEVTVRCRRPEPVDLVLASSAGIPAPWSGLSLRVVARGSERFAPGVFEDGEVRMWFAPGRSYEWKCHGSLGEVVGAGAFAVRAGQDRQVLVCAGIRTCVGRIAAGESTDGIVVDYESRLRGRGSESLIVARDRSFQVHVGTDDAAVRFSRGGASIAVAVPSDGEIADLGVIALAARPFAEVRITDPSGVVLPRTRVVPVGEHRDTSSVVDRETGRHVLYADRRFRAVELICSCPGYVEQRIRVSRGESLALALEPAVRLHVKFQCVRGFATDDVWVRLTERHRESGWRSVEHWSRVSRVGADVAASFDAIAAGTYRFEVLSTRPVCTLTAGEVELGPEIEAVVDLTMARQWQVEVQADDTQLSDCWLIAGSEALASGSSRVTRGVRRPVGAMVWTVASSEERVLVAARGVVPRWVRLRGSALVAVLESVDQAERDLLQVLTEGIAAAPFDSARLFHAYRDEADSVARQVGTIAIAFGDRAPFWPVDYSARASGSPGQAVWRGAGWSLSAGK